MTEDFLHHIWQYKLFEFRNMLTTDGEPLQVLSSGIHNNNAGPDFLNARVKIGDTTWAGNIEIHYKSSDWNEHHHQHDDSYDNIILHVVYTEDEKIMRSGGDNIPCLTLNNKVNPSLWPQYASIMKSRNKVPCAPQIEMVDKLTILHWKERLMIERLEEKTNYISDVLRLNKGDWGATFYQIMARNFGLKINALPFELLGKSLPYNTIAKHKNQLSKVEALIFGQAGMLEQDFSDNYPQSLKKEYRFLKKKYKLKPIDSGLWKFLRLRPMNFPTIRLAQFASLIHNSSVLFSKIKETKTVKEVKELLKAEPTEYWKTHYRFDKPSANRSKKLGDNTRELLLINTIIPLLFAYGIETDSEKYKSRALKFLEKLKSEKNSITNKWMELKIPNKSAFDSQALIQLSTRYCEKRRCLHCAIGNKILKKTVPS